MLLHFLVGHPSVREAHDALSELLQGSPVVSRAARTLTTIRLRGLLSLVHSERTPDAKTTVEGRCT
jgi:hypothetical protein